MRYVLRKGVSDIADATLRERTPLLQPSDRLYTTTCKKLGFSYPPGVGSPMLIANFTLSEIFGAVFTETLQKLLPILIDTSFTAKL